MNNAHEIKALQVRARKLEAEIRSANEEKALVTKRITQLNNELNTVNQHIDNITVKEPVVTEHAILRYLERVRGVDLQEISDAILTDSNRAIIDFAGTCNIETGGVTFVVKDRKVVSVVA